MISVWLSLIAKNQDLDIFSHYFDKIENMYDGVTIKFETAGRAV